MKMLSFYKNKIYILSLLSKCVQNVLKNPEEKFTIFRSIACVNIIIVYQS
jgi:hypothetical protein